MDRVELKPDYKSLRNKQLARLALCLAASGVLYGILWNPVIAAIPIVFGFVCLRKAFLFKAGNLKLPTLVLDDGKLVYGLTGNSIEVNNIEVFEVGAFSLTIKKIEPSWADKIDIPIDCYSKEALAKFSDALKSLMNDSDKDIEGKM